MLAAHWRAPSVELLCLTVWLPEFAPQHLVHQKQGCHFALRH
jgi:hypothetical protein